MKKLVASAMLVLYFVVSTGFVVSIHYCMDEVNAVELGASELDECGTCGMTITDNDGCCKDEVKVVKVQTDQLLSKLVKADFSLPIIMSTTTSFLFTPLFNTTASSAPVAHGPPLSGQETYLQNCVFRI
jgi:hypothetical protein